MAESNEQQQTAQQTAQISGTVQITPRASDASIPPGEVSPTPAPVAAAAVETPQKKRSRTWMIVGVVVLLVLAAGLLYWRSTYTEDTDDAQVDGDLYQVSSRVTGQVVHVDVEENTPIKQGDPIAEIDPKDYQVALEQAQANLATAKANFTEATANVPITSVTVRTGISTSGSDVLGSEANVLQAQAQVAAAQARVEQARANAVKAQSDVERYTPLVAKDVISKQQFDAAVASATANTASVSEAERNVKAQQDQVNLAQQRLVQSREQAKQSQQNAGKQVDVQRARAEAAFADIQQQQAKVDQAKLNLSYCRILAPTSGIVSKKSVSVGANLSIGQDLLTVVPLTNLWVTANFKETQLNHMQEGQIVDLKVDALNGRHFTGKITQIGGATGSKLSLFPPENATGNYVKVVQRIPVRIDFTNLAQENSDYALKPGMSVTPDVRIKN